MARRQAILNAMGKGGGTEAPNARRKQITEALRNGPSGARTLPGGALPSMRIPRTGAPGTRRQSLQQGGPGVAPGREASLSGLVGNLSSRTGARAQKAGAGTPGVGGAVQPKLGAQLSGRVSSGALNESQAQKVAQQRQLLRKAFGSDWRSQVYGKGGAKGISGPFAQRQVAAKRTAGLARAKKKLY